jgi:hypothetical protein
MGSKTTRGTKHNITYQPFITEQSNLRSIFVFFNIRIKLHWLLPKIKYLKQLLKVHKNTYHFGLIYKVKQMKDPIPSRMNKSSLFVVVIQANFETQLKQIQYPSKKFKIY